MKEKLSNGYKRIKGMWLGLSKKKRGWIIFLSAAAVCLIILMTTLSSIKHFTPLYSHLSASEAGQIKETLDKKNIVYKLSDDGSTISVPKAQVDQLKVELAAEGVPKSGQIDYSFFGENASFGMTDKEFAVLERAAMQTELSNLVTQIKGVRSAKVMLNLPERSVWVSDDSKQNDASASVVLELEPGYQLNNAQVQGLYHLISKSVPNLPEDNIVIMDQYFNYYDKKSSSNDSALSVYEQQKGIKQDIEKDLQRKVQQMLGMMMGQEKVMVNVTTDIDFTKEKSKEDLVKPVDKETMEGLQVSAEHITETYSGRGPGGKVGTGNTDIPEYPSTDNNDGSYKHIEDRINNEFNRIHKDIVNSPYDIKDLGIQVMVEPPNPNKRASLSPQRISDIKQILNTIIRTTLSDNGGKQLSSNEIDQKAIVTVEKFNGKPKAITTSKKTSRLWLYIGGGLILLIIIVLVMLLLRRRKAANEDLLSEITYHQSAQRVTDLEDEMENKSPEVQKYKQLEKLAKQKPDKFVKLLRSWLSED
ncbi:flagellar M-ring protein FliF [Scopulibacillus darangshiensis]|uniref:Flagellar M-ring protein n=1 Tax=Scopulibacillus darangshiensis TaxID=442528 RepID=A0A4R2P3D3_9BACL|nr:flagellar basal-body MS-ring/collar protein FliF [Scopulibacillus darangshiensis]TCP29182.1 flagellar M-ring protein FliF [Scopulibacillus darangshiensis]